MSTPTSIARYIPRGEVALKRTVSADDFGNAIVDEVIEKSIYKPVVFPQDPVERKAMMEEYHALVVRECEYLQKAFPPKTGSPSEMLQRSSMYSLLYHWIEKNNMPIDRLRDSISNIISTQRFHPKIADVLDYDKKIILATNKASLSRKLKRPIIDIELAITYEIVDGKVVRLFGLLEDMQSIPDYSERVLAVWDDEEHTWNWIGHVDDPSIPERQKRFKESLFRFCKCPGYPGAYDVEVVKAFYDYFSKVVPPGDRMLWETKMSFDIETWLETFNRKYIC